VVLAKKQEDGVAQMFVQTIGACEYLEGSISRWRAQMERYPQFAFPINLADPRNRVVHLVKV
jgi:hypothetical protein